MAALDDTARLMPDIIYLAWGRPQRPRANLIQTLHTVEALMAQGASIRLYVPPLPRHFDRSAFLSDMGVRRPIDLRGTATLHRQWGGWPFVLLHRALLRGAGCVYTRVPQLSRVLARSGVPHFVEIHDVETLRRRGLEERLVASCRRGEVRGVVTISEAARNALLSDGVPADRLHVAPSGVDLDAFSAVAPLRPEQLAAPRAIYVGRISHDRGLLQLERIAARGCEVRLVGPRDDEPDPAVTSLRTTPAVPHAKVPDCYAAAEIALMPYQSGLQHAASISPIKLFEAMAAGRLVLASDLAPIREIVTDGVDGLLLPPTDPDAWIRAIAWVRAHPRDALAIAQAGRQRAAQFSWRARAERLLTIMEIGR